MTAMTDYRWEPRYRSPSNDVVWPAVSSSLLRRVALGSTILDVGCGNGELTAQVADLGYSVSGIETSASGVASARAAHPDLEFRAGSAYEDLGGPYDAIVSLEVIEHLYSPHLLAQNAFKALRPGGYFIVSTPYHGYWKNLAIAVANKWDHHHSALTEHDHIKFFSLDTLGKLLSAAGFEVETWRRVGRVPVLAKSMVAVARRPL